MFKFHHPRQKLAVLCVTLLALFGLTPVASAQEVPFTGVIVRDGAPARSGGNKDFYAVAMLHKGQQVKVEEIVYGWYKISPPEGAASVIDKGAVQPAADGKSGTVTAESAQVFAFNCEPGAGGQPGVSWRTQGELKKGATVLIAGESGSFIKIFPPPGAYVWIAPADLRRATTEDLATPTPTPSPAVTPTPKPADPKPVIVTTVAPPVVTTPPTTQPVTTTTVATPATTAPSIPLIETPDTTTTTTPPPASATVPEIPVVRGPTSSELFLAAELQFRQAMTAPVEDQPVDELLQTYQTLVSSRSLLPSEATIARARILQLQRNAKIAAEINRINALHTAIRESNEALSKKLAEQAKPQPGRARDASQYDYVGQLLGSSVYDGGRMPLLYRLAESKTLRTIAYVSPGDNVPARVYLGQVVGIMGRSTYDASLKLNVVEVREIDVLAKTEPTVPDTQPGDAK